MVEVFLSAGYRLIQISLKLLYDGYVPVVAEQRRLYTCKYHRLILKRQISIQQIDPTRLWKAMSDEGLTTLATLRVVQCAKSGTGQILAQLLRIKLVEKGQKSPAFLSQMVKFWWGNSVGPPQSV